MVATRQITVDEFETMPLDGMWELIDGELVEVPPSAYEPSTTAMIVGYILLNHVRPRGLGLVSGADGGFALFPDRQTVLAPDVAFVAAARAPQGEARQHFPRLAPDLAVEVRSPSDRPGNVLAKVALYLQAGVRLVWVVDPATRTVTVYRPEGTPEVLEATATLDGGDVLPGFAVPIAEFFAS